METLRNDIEEVDRATVRLQGFDLRDAVGNDVTMNANLNRGTCKKSGWGSKASDRI